MILSKNRWLPTLGAIVSLGAVLPASAGDSAPAPDASLTADTRYGLFNGLDHRSAYGKGVFPEPFLTDDSDLEVNELRFDYFYERQPDHSESHQMKFEIEKGFGNLTLEVEIPYEIDRSPDGRVHGWDNIDLGARYPFYQFVSKSGFFDTTFGVAVEVGVPTNSAVSKNTELVPKIFNDTKIGNFTIQSIFGYSMLYGPGEDGGLHTFEYGFMFGYAIQKPFQGMEQIIPFFEISGERELNHDDSGHNSLIGNVGFRFNTTAIGRFQPRIGIGYVFPLDKGAQSDIRSGVFTSLVFEF